MSTGSARPLEDAFRISQLDLIRWLAGVRHGGARRVPVVSQVARRPSRSLRPNYTFVSKIRKQYLPGGDVYGGVHGRLRAMASAYRGERR